MLGSVFGKSLWERRLSALWWGLGTAAIAGLLVAFFPSLRDSPAMTEFLEQFPPEVLAALCPGERSAGC